MNADGVLEDIVASPMENIDVFVSDVQAKHSELVYD
jgi:hypothetical protein